MARTSLEHSFMPGASLWSEGREFKRTAACEGDEASDSSSAKCHKFLAGSERARVQWELEQTFTSFEKKFQSAEKN
jgi:adenosine deaminase